MAQTMLNMAAMFQNVRIPENARPITVDLPTPPALTGALTPNNWLAKAQRLAFNRVRGPESLAIDRNGNLYTGLSNGWVVEVRPNGRVRGLQRMSLSSCGRTRVEGACGRPLGMRLDSQGLLVFADAYNGIFKMDKRNGRFLRLVDPRRQRVGGRPLGFLNDLAVTQDGTIFFTSSSTKWKRSQFLNIVLEGEKSGRVLVYNPRARGPNKVQQVMAGLSFPNGLQLSRDQDYLLIAEGARAKIYRKWIGRNSPNRGRTEVFADNLPGFVDNIRLSPRGTYWVALSSVRHSAQPSVLDSYGTRPDIRRQIMGLPKDVAMSRAPKYGLVVELNEDGKIIRSLHDPFGSVFPSVSEVQEFQGKLYLGSYDRNFIGVLSLNSLPTPVKPGTGHTPTQPPPTHNHRPIPTNPRPNPNNNHNHRPNPNPNPNPNPDPKPKPNPSSIPNPNPNPNPNSNPNPNPNPQPKPSAPNPKPNIPSPSALLGDERTPLGQMLAQMNRHMDKLDGEELRDMVLVLLKQVIETKKEASKTLQRAVRLKSDTSKLKTMLGLSDGPAVPSPGSSRTDNTGTGNSGATAGSGGTGTQSESTTPSTTTTTVTETTSDSGSTGTAASAGTTPQSTPASGGGGGGGAAGVFPTTPTFGSGCVSGSLSCGVY